MHAFEHFAKERCLLSASAFPQYRVRGHRAETPWWSHGERERRVPPRVIDAVLAEVRERGPVSGADIEDHGAVEPLDWSGWKGTARATSMALEILWTRCDIVVAGRTESGAKVYDVPERALGEYGIAEPNESFEPWAVRDRVAAAGLLTRAAGGSLWSMLRDVRTSGVVDELVARGEVVDVVIEGSTRRYLASPQFVQQKPRFDDRVRILGPLDPLLWDRDLVRHLFDFEYVWEVYKPAHLRKWGWYVCPLLHRDRFIGRVDARIEGDALIVRKLWLDAPEQKQRVGEALERHATACGATRVKMPRR